LKTQPFTWRLGQAKPTMNQFSWTNLSSVLWVEQPVGTGFSQGTPNIKVSYSSFVLRQNLEENMIQDEHDLAVQLVGFMQQFLDVFAELKGKKLFLTGESVSSFLF
jgi:carboxypeptidase D